MKILIIEDEIRAAQQLQSMLQILAPNAIVIDTLESVEDSIIWFRKNEGPDLIFMDIQLADGLSFEIFQHTDVSAPVIFTTAFDQYSIKAFKVNSIDYLLKPIQEEDLSIALNKFQSLYQNKQAQRIDNLTIEKLINNLTSDKFRQRFIVKEGNSMSFVQTEDVAYFYSEDGLSFLVTHHNKRYIVDMTLDAIEKDIDARQFSRINRGQIVNVETISKIHPYFNHRLKLELKANPKQDFIVSRNRTAEFKDWINQ